MRNFAVNTDLRAVKAAFADRNDNVIHALILLGVGTAVCIVFGTVTAYASARRRPRARRVLARKL